jgi:hypothetical protein
MTQQYDPHSIHAMFSEVLTKLDTQDRERKELHLIIREQEGSIQEIRRLLTSQEMERALHMKEFEQVKKDLGDVIKKVEPIYVAAIRTTTIAGALYFIFMVFSEAIRDFVLRMFSHHTP